MMNAVNVPDHIYDFNNEDNLAKWKGVLTTALKKVLETVHPSLEAQEDALEYVENLCLRLLAMLCAKPSPHTVQDVEYRVQSTFPTPIDKWALKEAQEAVDRRKKKSALLLPVDKIHSLLQKELLLYKVDLTVSLFLVAVLEYISADILKLAGNYVKHIKQVEITYQDVQISMNADKALMDMFYQDEGNGAGIPTETQVLVSAAPRTSLTYEEVVRELIASEKAYMRELHMLIKVFREELIKLGSDQREIDCIFSNIMDLYELTYTLSGSLEDVIEMAQDQMPYIGSCFEELAEAEEFQVYSKYAKDVTSARCRETLNNLLSRPEIESSLISAGQGMRLALKYYLPALLMGPIRHCFSYMEYIRILKELSSAEDKESLEQVEVMLKPLQMELGRCVPSSALPRTSTPLLQIRARRQAALEKIQELEKIVENWDSKDIGQCCNEFVREDVLLKVSNGKRLTDRRVFLFDGLMILCKPNTRRQSSIHHLNHPECRLKERFFIRKVEIIDHQDTDELRNSFEICPRQQQTPVMLCTKSLEEKNSWMADLVMLNNRSMLERILDSILSDIERKHPLKLPPPQIYKFSEPDSRDNIILEQRENGGVPLIKGATLYKLVERMTYHIYADTKFVRTFLTTYRSFCAPNELLDLLIERFSIPDPSLVYEQDCFDTEKMQKCNQREDWKKYRKEYCQPVQFRVLNVLRHWVDHHFYDFEREPELLSKLEKFLDSVNGKSMRKWVDSVLKIVQRKRENDTQRHIKFAFAENPPPIEWHIPCGEEDYGILTLHPVEIARQLTVLEFDLYRNIKPSELVGSVWTKKDKDKTSPNLLKMIKHTTNFTIWLEKNIVEADNFEERVAIYNRIIEIMIALNEINNFNGVLAIVSATASASIHRLKLTYQALSQQKQKALEECRSDDHFKKYQEKLRSINPPCVPFLGMYLTNILHIEEGNPDFLPNTQLVNFFKRRKVAEITGEIQQYQNQPYIYTVEPKIRHFLENLSPFGDMSENEINNYLYNKSIEIEPRGCKQIPKFPRKWPHLNLKSPGIKSKTSSVRQLINSTSAVGSSTLSSASMVSVSTIGSSSKSSNNNEEPKSEDSSRSDNDFSVFAPVQLGSTGQNSPTSSPVSPAGPLSWRTAMHIRSPSTSSTSTIASIRCGSISRSDVINAIPVAPRNSTSVAPNSPGPRSPVSPTFESISPRLPCTPPPIPPRRRRDSPEISSPQQMKQAPDAPMLPPRESSPPPLPPRRETGLSPSAFSHSHQSSLPSSLTMGMGGTLPRLNPTHTSQLHIRRHSSQPQQPSRPVLNGGAIGKMAISLLNPKAEVARAAQALAVNISAAKGIQDVMKSNLGPKGTMKMLVSGSGDIKITKDGNVLLHEMQIQHPTASLIARASTAQDDMTGDGTTSTVLVIGELLKQADIYISEGLHPRVLADGFDKAREKTLEVLEQVKIPIEINRENLLSVCRTSLRTKIHHKIADLLAEECVDAVLTIKKDDKPVDLHMVEIMEMQHKSETNTKLVRGLVLDHGSRHPDMPKHLENCYILTCNVSMEYEKSEVNSGFYYKTSEDREKMVLAEREFIEQRVKKVVELKRKLCNGTKKTFVLINQKGIDPLSLDILAKEGIIALRRAKRRNMERLALACGGLALNSFEDLQESQLGYAGTVYEHVLGENKFTFVEDCKNPNSVTLLVKGPNKHTLVQLKDAIRDGLRAVNNAIGDAALVPGAGAFEVTANKVLNEYKDTVKGKARLGIAAYAEALLVIPKVLATNSGYDAQDTIVKLQEECRLNSQPVGIDLNSGEPLVPKDAGILDNYVVKKQIINSCSIIASNLILVDEIMRAGLSSLKG